MLEIVRFGLEEWTNVMTYRNCYFFLLLVGCKCFAGGVEVIPFNEGLISPYKIEYIEILDDAVVPSWLGSSAIGAYSVSCGYRKIYGTVSVFTDDGKLVSKNLELNELLSEGCRETTEIALRGEYLYLSNRVNGTDVVIDAALVIDRVNDNSLMVEHEDGKFLEVSRYFDVKHKKKCEASFYEGEAECIELIRKASNKKLY